MFYNYDKQPVKINIQRKNAMNMNRKKKKFNYDILKGFLTSAGLYLIWISQIVLVEVWMKMKNAETAGNSK